MKKKSDTTEIEQTQLLSKRTIKIQRNATLEYPKSHIFNKGAGLPSINVFSNFKSR